MRREAGIGVNTRQEASHLCAHFVLSHVTTTYTCGHTQLQRGQSRTGGFEDRPKDGHCRNEDTGFRPFHMLEVQGWRSPVWIPPLRHMSRSDHGQMTATPEGQLLSQREAEIRNGVQTVECPVKTATPSLLDGGSSLPHPPPQATPRSPRPTCGVCCCACTTCMKQGKTQCSLSL